MNWQEMSESKNQAYADRVLRKVSIRDEKLRSISRATAKKVEEMKELKFEKITKTSRQFSEK